MILDLVEGHVGHDRVVQERVVKVVVHVHADVPLSALVPRVGLLRPGDDDPAAVRDARSTRLDPFTMAFNLVGGDNVSFGG